MVFFNYATMQMAAKIVYYGPGLCGKTTNLHFIYQKTSPQSRGEMVSLETETDRTLFFDLLPIDVGVIGGFKTRLQLYTIPGQVFYNTTRKLVLKGVDGIVFVADSQTAMLDANLESFRNLRENLAEIGLDLDDIPLVLQLNKRDLPNISSVDALVSVLDADRKYEYVEAVASTGVGVFETLKTISKLTLRTLRRRMSGEEPVKTPRRPAAEVATFRVHDSARTIAATTPLPASTVTPPVVAPPTFTAPATVAASAAAAPSITRPIPVPVEEETVEEIEADSEIVEPPPAPPFADETLAKTANLEPDLLTSAPVEDVGPALSRSAPSGGLESPPHVEAAPEPELIIPETEKPEKAEPEVKHVKVRSSIDIMAELESLRKRATSATPRTAARVTAADVAIPVVKPKRDIAKTLHLSVPGVVPQSRSLRVTVSFENSEGVVETREESVDLGDTSEVQSLSVNLRFDI
jgi:signal recognition particle receptor subunit beta